jgi:hypothetical protein
VATQSVAHASVELLWAGAVVHVRFALRKRAVSKVLKIIKQHPSGSTSPIYYPALDVRQHQLADLLLFASVGIRLHEVVKLVIAEPRRRQQRPRSSQYLVKLVPVVGLRRHPAIGVSIPVGVDAVINQHLLELPVVRASALGLWRICREQGAA